MTPRSHSEASAPRPAYRGGSATFLYEHRAFVRAPNRLRRYGEAALLTLSTVAVWFALLPLVGRGWGHALNAIGGDGRVVMTLHEVGFLTAGVPHLVLDTGMPGPGLWWAAALGTAALFGATFFLPDRMTPVCYALRAVVLIQGSAVIYFAFWADQFPYTLEDYLRAMMATGLVIATVTPIVLGLIWHVQDIAWPKKLALAVLMQGYAIVLIPLQYAVHGIVLEHATMLFMPLLYVLFGIPAHVLALVALYAWGMSWEGALPTLGIPVTASA